MICDDMIVGILYLNFMIRGINDLLCNFIWCIILFIINVVCVIYFEFFIMDMKKYKIRIFGRNMIIFFIFFMMLLISRVFNGFLVILLCI